MSTLSELLFYCKEANSFGALMFTGKWGCGKTYLIDKELSKELGQDFIIIRISLFGESSVDSINKKVQKAYFQNLMLHMGSYVEDIAQRIPNVTKKQVKKFAKSTQELTGKVAEISDKLNTSKVGGLVRFVSEIAKKIPGVEKIFSLSPSDYISVEKTIADKKVILVFDDLERANLDEIDVMGCINEYCENKQIKTIIIANEEKILEKYAQAKMNRIEEENGNEDKRIKESSGVKLGYSEIKEKIITRTVKHIADYDKIIAQIIDEFVEDEPFYKEFLQEHKIDLTNVFKCSNSENIRSIKCAIQDFQRVFIELHKKGLDDEMKIYFQTFAAFMFQFKDGKIDKSEQYGYLFSDYDIEKDYPGLFISKYMLPSVEKWILEGEWDSDNINNEINKMIDAKKATEPKDIVRNTDLISLDEDIIEAGFPEVASLAYAGQLSVDEYIILLRNILWSRNISYTLPVEVDMDKLMDGVQKCLDTLCESDERDSRVSIMIHPDNISLLTTEERYIYMKICEFRDKNLHMFAINKREYLYALSTGNVRSLYHCDYKRYNVFDKEIANAVMKCYKFLSNAERQVFIDIFRKMWESNIGSQDFLKEDSISGFEELKVIMEDNRCEERDNNYSLKAALSGMFIKNITIIIETLKAQN